MTETPEIPEAEHPFDKPVAITIAVLAVALSLIGNLGDNAKTESIIKTSQAADQWSLYQAKSVKEHAYEIQAQTLGVLNDQAVDPTRRAQALERAKVKASEYAAEKKLVGPGLRDATGHWQASKDDQGQPIISAKELEEEARHDMQVNDQTDKASLFLQIGVILCSVAILTKRRRWWYSGITMGIIGGTWGAWAFWLNLG